MTIHHNGVIYYRMAEKRKPTYDLQAFKAVFSTVQRLAVTGVALRSAAALGFGRSEIVETIQTMQREHFYNLKRHIPCAKFNNIKDRLICKHNSNCSDIKLQS